MREPTEPAYTTLNSNRDITAITDAVVFVAKAIMYGCYMIAEAIENKRPYLRKE